MTAPPPDATGAATRAAPWTGRRSPIGLELAARHPVQVRALVAHEPPIFELEFFIGYEVPPFNKYVPDIAALKTSLARVVAAVGDASAGEPQYRTAIAVAERLGTQPVDTGGADV